MYLKNQSAPRPEHPPVMGEKVSKRLGGIKGCKYKISCYIYSKSMDQPGKVANPARGQLNRENKYSPLSAFVPENLVSRDGFGSPVPSQPAHLHPQAESGAYLRDSSRVPRQRPYIYLKPPYAVGSVPSLSGHAIAYRWRSPPRVRRRRAAVNLKVVPNECCLSRSPWTN